MPRSEPFPAQERDRRQSASASLRLELPEASRRSNVGGGGAHAEELIADTGAFLTAALAWPRDCRSCLNAAAKHLSLVCRASKQCGCEQSDS